MVNSADPDQLASKKPTDLDLQCLQRQDKPGFSRTRVNIDPTEYFNEQFDRVSDALYHCISSLFILHHVGGAMGKRAYGHAYSDSEGPDQPMHLHSLFRAFTVH